MYIKNVEKIVAATRCKIQHAAVVPPVDAE